MKKKEAGENIAIISLTLNKIKKEIENEHTQKELDYIIDELEKIAVSLAK